MLLSPLTLFFKMNFNGKPIGIVLPTIRPAQQVSPPPPQAPMSPFPTESEFEEDIERRQHEVVKLMSPIPTESELDGEYIDLMNEIAEWEDRNEGEPMDISADDDDDAEDDDDDDDDHDESMTTEFSSDEERAPLMPLRERRIRCEHCGHESWELY